MTRIATVLVFVWVLALSAGSFPARAAEKAIVGAWECVSVNPEGEKENWTLTVKEEDGKLSGTLVGDPGQFPLIAPKMEGDTFTTRVAIAEEEYSLEIKVSEKKLQGTVKGSTAQGTITGVKQS